ncbi:MAG: DUF2764 domain-containing protein [Treponema sp.]|nr:DUF2764 domain-containing protein [Treponema sp.]
MAYYYLLAQLPGLSYGQAAPMKSRDFRELAAYNLGAADAAWLDLCTLNPVVGAACAAGKGTPEFFRRWQEYERALRLNLARYRAAKTRRDAPPDTPEHPADAAAAAKAAAALDSPLEAEIFLDEARWKAIEYFQGITYFDRNTVYAYLLKLLLMERRSSFRAEEGFAEYKGLYAAVMEGYSGGAGLNSQSGEPK